MGRSAEKQPQASSPTNNEAGNPTPFELEPYEKLPEWRQDNPYILASYRPISNSYLQSVKSLAYLHNQTGNIYTHLLFLIPVLGLVTYSSLMLYGFETSLVSPRNDDILAFSAFFGGAAACMALSTAYHTFANHSEAVALRGKQLDFAGILCLIWGSLMPTLFYTFPCEVGLMRAYMVVFSTSGAIALMFVLSPLATKLGYKSAILPLFLLFAASGIFPLGHGVVLYGWERLDELVGLKYVLLHGAIYLASLGPFKFPECWKPGTFDIWLSSHQLFHIGVVLAASVHFIGLLKAYTFQHAHWQVEICPLLRTWKAELVHDT